MFIGRSLGEQPNSPNLAAIAESESRDSMVGSSKNTGVHQAYDLAQPWQEWFAETLGLGWGGRLGEAVKKLILAFCDCKKPSNFLGNSKRIFPDFRNLVIFSQLRRGVPTRA
jgi:hypothetical protein